jgi:hypothetical protein
VGYEKARLVAAHADDTTVEALIERAQGLTCMNLKFELEARERAQICARGELDLRVPRGVGALLDAAVRAAREVAGYWLSPGECVTRIAEHFVGTWEKALAERSTRQKKVIARDAGSARCRAAAGRRRTLTTCSTARGAGLTRSRTWSACVRPTTCTVCTGAGCASAAGRRRA